MKLSYEGLQQKEAWKNAGVTLPEYDWKAMCEATEKAPVWVHFGAGNISVDLLQDCSKDF